MYVTPTGKTQRVAIPGQNNRRGITDLITSWHLYPYQRHLFLAEKLGLQTLLSKNPPRLSMPHSGIMLWHVWIYF